MKKFLIGGALRDYVMGIEPKDRDYVVIGETVESMLAMGFSQVGKDFPVFLHPETNEEYALARRERKTGKGYSGFSVDTMHVSLEEDCSRRDFRFNSMAMNLETGEIIDPFNGMNDIRDRMIRHTSDAFSEDPLRVIRAFRFSARYMFDIAAETKLLMRSMITTGQLNQLPVERFWVEMEKAFQDEHPHFFIESLFNNEVNVFVEFFKILFDGVSFRDAFDLAFDTMKFDAHKRLDYFIGTLAYNNPRIAAFPSALAGKIATVFKYIRLDWNDEYVPESIYGLLVKMGVYREGGVENEVCDILRARNFNYREHLESDFVYNLGTITLAVKAENFPKLSGKELGEAIKNARIKKICDILEW